MNGRAERSSGSQVGSRQWAWWMAAMAVAGAAACTTETKVKTKVVQGDCAPGADMDAADTQGTDAQAVDTAALDTQPLDTPPPQDSGIDALPGDSTAAVDATPADVQQDATGDIPPPPASFAAIAIPPWSTATSAGSTRGSKTPV